ncbi:MAG: hypothetical protein JXD19_12230 [Deltaproteobacteria bacterium]|nr:hypothetical protein [Deltaproteobacteria bacterium]
MIVAVRIITIAVLIWLIAGLWLTIGILAGEEGDVAPGSHRAGVTARKQRNPDFAVSVESVLSGRKEKQDIVLVDIRSPEKFEQFSIPGSINIPLFAVKTKAFLKSQLLVLVDEGYRICRLERACGDLRKSGFAVRYLKGGLSSWRDTGAPLTGDVFAQRELNRVPSRIFFEEKECENWLVIDVSRTGAAGKELFPRSVSIPYSETGEFTERLKATIQESHRIPPASVLVVDETGEHCETLERRLKAEGLKSIFFLQGGLEAYETFLKNQAMARKAKGNSKRTIRKCAGCP